MGLAVVADAAIVGYQRYLSPRKGFRCAYRARTGGLSCSQFARVIVRRLGVFALPAAMRHRFAKCRAAHFCSISEYPDPKNPPKEYPPAWHNCAGCGLDAVAGAADCCSPFSI